ncbi:hypothetical protein F6R98_12005 [Candidatus Methylospira mobilis]|uniref:Uncharacterized protein n=1 Tax=Candidatus Methylospira mobilis TaxID=1808979 RepID=A0A5Q0BHA1_9GAMM|nr:hypothetical protein [Candidatus Methylospira mobilis]QFY43255.1 hypothetical protein F6R98_12005 [Candidatus Methylospira mobilis]WNV03546.1 hypothetical protein RP726_13955 [Candidatus Methylospira mobilis]
MEFQPIKLLAAFIGVMAVGFGIVALNKETPQEKQQGVLLQTSSMLNSLGTDKCAEAARAQIGTHPYKPDESDSDRMTYVNLKWNNAGGTGKKIECRYVLDQGVILLKVDGATVVEKDRIGGDAGASRPQTVHH